jgi:hypothetical protein
LPFPTFVGGEDVYFVPEALACFVCDCIHLGSLLVARLCITVAFVGSLVDT